MVDRIRLIMEYAKLSQQDFAARIEISAASLSGILTGRSQPTNKHVMGIHRAFPEINVNWLMFGEGNMLASKEASESSDGENANGNLSLDFSDMGAVSEATVRDNASLPLGTNQAVGESVNGAGFANNGMAGAAYGKGRDVRGSGRIGGNPSVGGMLVENDGRKIKEIRVFFSNGTYESFVPSNK